jgi:hypothetical protein
MVAQSGHRVTPIINRILVILLKEGHLDVNEPPRTNDACHLRNDPFRVRDVLQESGGEYGINRFASKRQVMNVCHHPGACERNEIDANGIG